MKKAAFVTRRQCEEPDRDAVRIPLSGKTGSANVGNAPVLASVDADRVNSESIEMAPEEFPDSDAASSTRSSAPITYDHRPAFLGERTHKSHGSPDQRKLSKSEMVRRHREFVIRLFQSAEEHASAKMRAPSVTRAETLH